jgi:DnaA family protein
MNQLDLPILLNSKMLLSNFVGTDNKQVADFINSLFNQKKSCLVYIYGGKSSGKTHLLQGSVFKAVAKNLKAAYIDPKQEISNKTIPKLDSFDWVCFDNIDYLNLTQQYELFEIFNKIKLSSTKLIVSAQDLPNNLNFFKDLKTRLSSTFMFSLTALSDYDKINVLESKMRDRNLKVDKNIYSYLFKHYSRDLTELLDFIDKLDKISLQQKNKINIKLAKQFL